MKSSVTMLKPVKAMMDVRNAKKVTMKWTVVYVALYVFNRTSNLDYIKSHLLDYINRLH